MFNPEASEEYSANDEHETAAWKLEEPEALEEPPRQLVGRGV